jgi:uncharacterized integral membrane protein (TIGR00698 family)
VELRNRWKQLVVPAVLVASPASPGLALASGVVLVGVLPEIVPEGARKVQKLVLSGSVVLLGLSVDPLHVVHSAGRGFSLSVVTLLAVFALGFLLARLLRVPDRIAALVCSGTAICGGSAIAAAGSAMEADPAEIGTALGAVFLLNAVGLYLLPFLGHRLGLDPTTYGTWSGLALHDLSSVVGAASQGGPKALETALATKLARTLWIAPTALALGAVFGRKDGDGRRKLQVPWFILGFFALAASRLLFPGLSVLGPAAAWIARKGMVLALFLVGTGLTVDSLRRTGPRVLWLAVALWLSVLVGTYWAIR